jgi:diguanylate cyclase (GGDEF)-like protein/PAS domain S-box-containing protein
LTRARAFGAETHSAILLQRLLDLLEIARLDEADRDTARECIDRLAVHLDEQTLALDDILQLQTDAIAALSQETAVFKCLPFAAVRVDADLYVLDQNTRATACLGPIRGTGLPNNVLPGAMARPDFDMLRRTVATAQKNGTAMSEPFILRCPMAVGPDTDDASGLVRAHCICTSLRDDFKRLIIFEPVRTDSHAEMETLRALVDRTEFLIWATDQDGTVTLASAAFAASVGSDPNRIVGQALSAVLPVDEAVFHRNWDRQIAQTAKAVTFRESRHCDAARKPGAPPVRREFETTKFPLIATGGRVSGVATMSTDITREVEQAKMRRLSEQVFGQSSDGIVLLDADLNIEMVNPAFERTMGFGADGVKGHQFEGIFLEKESLGVLRKIKSSLNLYGRWAGEVLQRAASGRRVVVWCSINRLTDADGHKAGYVAVQTDLTRVREVETENARLAHFDHLTGLPNRVELMEQLAEMIAFAQVSDRTFGVVFMDLDQFKSINDSLGHSAGDRLLKTLASRLSAILRGDEFLARIGGDEFVLLLPGLTPEQAYDTISRFAEAVRRPFDLDDLSDYQASASFGVALYPEDGQTTEALLRRADTAMYSAKAAGRDRIVVFNEKLGEEAAQTLNMRNAVVPALANGEIELHYQPVFGLKDRRVCGAEALVRWNRPGFGLLYPGEFFAVDGVGGPDRATGLFCPAGGGLDAGGMAAARPLPGQLDHVREPDGRRYHGAQLVRAPSADDGESGARVRGAVRGHRRCRPADRTDRRAYGAAQRYGAPQPARAGGHGRHAGGRRFRTGLQQHVVSAVAADLDAQDRCVLRAETGYRREFERVGRGDGESQQTARLPHHRRGCGAGKPGRHIA